MDTEALGRSKLVNLLLKPAGFLMGSRLRTRFMNPIDMLGHAGVRPAQQILEVGCGTGFFTLPAAHMVGAQGRLIALDASAGFLEVVARKVAQAKLSNVDVLCRDALVTKLETASIDKVLLLGVIPFPLLPLDRLLPEMHRVLKANGSMAVWLFPPCVHAWVPGVIEGSRLFELVNRSKRLYHFKKVALPALPDP